MKEEKSNTAVREYSQGCCLDGELLTIKQILERLRSLEDVKRVMEKPAVPLCKNHVDSTPQWEICNPVAGLPQTDNRLSSLTTFLPLDSLLAIKYPTTQEICEHSCKNELAIVKT